jgi:hypothetical protein
MNTFMRTSTLLSIGLPAAALVLALALNPSPERHREKIRQTIGERSPVARVLGMGAIAAFASTYHSLGVASYTTAGDKTLSVGAFGLVYVLQP